MFKLENAPCKYGFETDIYFLGSRSNLILRISFRFSLDLAAAALPPTLSLSAPCSSQPVCLYLFLSLIVSAENERKSFLQIAFGVKKFTPKIYGVKLEGRRMRCFENENVLLLLC